ncbi:LPS-assembly protein LptD [Bartonella sp. CB189]|uniref:LPS-assembly protein LptD n=1 Tax=Bartonella sp. CB189 TaxID=3112254 RepID=UPI002F96E292
MKLLLNKQTIKKLSILIIKSFTGCLLSIFCFCYALVQNSTSLAQNFISNSISPILLSADELIYNHDTNIISLQGNVQVEYDGNKVVAKKMIYNKKTGRIIAQGNVEIIQKNGNKIHSNHINITKDFGEGFINSLRIDTADNIHFAADSATRSNNQITIFNNAAYTACEPCLYKSDKKILWKIKAKKIIWNSAIKKIRLENSRFEFFGIPLIKLPTFELYDPTVKRISGLLVPHFFYSDHLGTGVKNSYFWNLAPHYDFTLFSTLYTQQGVLTEGEWRQRFKTGNYNLRFAHIYQFKPYNFDKNTIDAQRTNRYMFATKGDFRLNTRWTYGWDIFTQSDQNFSRTYKLENYSNPVQLSQLYLNGLAGKNYFDMRFYHFKVQNMFNNNYNEHASEQAWVLPRINYSFSPNESIYTGLLTFHSNMQLVHRRHTDFNSTYWNNHPINATQPPGIAGNNFRLTNELEWKKRFNMRNGLILTPILSLRTDILTINAQKKQNAQKKHDNYITNDTSPAIRGIATAGLELRYPFSITSGNSTYIMEPIVQFFMRNNERYIEQISNEDAQSFIFDATTLFQRNKFSGYDRVEGGTRANIGIRYSGNLNDNWFLNGLIGQSFHLAGKNSFSEGNLNNSGLEATRSDYVAALSANHKNNFYMEFRGRFDQKTGKIRHSEIEALQKWKNIWASAQYAYIPKENGHEYTKNRQEISFQTGFKLADYWSVGGNAAYDLVSGTFVKRGISVNYRDECFTLTLSYQQITNPNKTAPLQNLNFSLSLHTVSDIGKGIKSGLWKENYKVL